VLKTGQAVELTLESLAAGGDAVGHYDGQAVFVPFGAPGDRARVRVGEAHRTYCRAVIEQLLDHSPDRVTPRCPLFGRCGGCQWQLLSYPAQLEQKRRILHDALARIGGIAPPGIVIVPDPTGWGYRNKAQFPVAGRPGELRAGFYRRDSHEIVPVSHCPIAVEPVNRAWPAVLGILQSSGLAGYDEQRHRGLLRHAVLRSGSGGALSLTLVTLHDADLGPVGRRLAAAVPGVVSVWQNINPGRGNAILGSRWRHLCGEPHLPATVAGSRLRLSPGAFLQANLPQAAQAYRLLAEALATQPHETVLDLYCGAGAIALLVAGRARAVIGIEEVPQAVEDAAAGAASSGIANCRFIAGAVERRIMDVGSASVVVLDPPRKGAGASLWPEIKRLAPRTVAYLSCNAATLARDAAALTESGYRLERLWLLDFFPQTHHVEALAVFQLVAT